VENQNAESDCKIDPNIIENLPKSRGVKKLIPSRKIIDSV